MLGCRTTLLYGILIMTLVTSLQQTCSVVLPTLAKMLQYGDLPPHAHRYNAIAMRLKSGKESIKPIK